MNDDLVVKEATLEDRRAIWEWRHDPITYKLFRISDGANYDQHRKWYDHVLGTGETILLVGLAETIRIGIVRFDRAANDEYEVNIYLRPPYCGRGYTSILLNQAINHLTAAHNVRRVVANIKRVNPSSGKQFKEAGFRIVEQEDRLECSWSAI